MEFGNATTKEIVSEVANKTAESQKVVGHVYYKLLEVIEEKLKDGKRIVLPNVGVFYFVSKKSSISNLTHQVVPPHKQLKFKINVKLARFIRVMSRP